MTKIVIRHTTWAMSIQTNSILPLHHALLDKLNVFTCEQITLGEQKTNKLQMTQIDIFTLMLLNGL